VVVEKECVRFGKKKIYESMGGARQESAAALGNDGMYLEKLIEEPRHIEIQVVGIHTEKHVTFLKEIVSYKGVIKMTEETPSPFMTDELRQKWVKQQLKQQNTSNMSWNGRILVDKHRNFYFMEMNTRIQVEHLLRNRLLIMT
jgi:acetyl-CoA carboxylase biotin carboxylase subunit